MTQIEKVNKQYKAKANKNYTYLEFKLEDLIWLHFGKEWFCSRREKKRSLWLEEMTCTRLYKG